jgi:hypothetical protein
MVNEFTMRSLCWMVDTNEAKEILASKGLFKWIHPEVI